MQRIFGLLVALALSVAGCSPPPVSKIATFRLEPSTLEQRQAAARVLTARFDGYRVESQVLEDAVVIQFRGRAPEDFVLRTIGTTQGVFRVSPADAKQLLVLSDLDIEDAAGYAKDGGGVLMLKLSEQAGARVMQFTSRNVGRVLVTTLDRKELTRASIAGAFGRSFETTGLDPRLARDLGVILRHGRLPVAVMLVDIRNAP